jgi:DNA-binding transcriptional LysR family regulator
VQLRQLEYFIAVADAGSFTAAAANLLIAQPSLSHQIQLLERELGVKLFERLPRGIRLTPAGRIFLDDARDALTTVSRATRRARQAGVGALGELHVGTVRSLSVGLLPPPVALWHAQHPSAVMRLREFVHKDELEDAIRSGYGDIGVGPRPHRAFEEQVDLGEEEFVVVMSSADDLAHAPAVDLFDLRDRLWVLFASDHGLSEIVGDACRKAGFTPKGAVHTYQVEAAVRFAAAGLGPTLVPRNVIPTGVEAAVIPLDPPLSRTLCAFSREPLTALASTFLSYLQGSISGRRFV